MTNKELRKLVDETLEAAIGTAQVVEQLEGIGDPGDLEYDKQTAGKVVHNLALIGTELKLRDRRRR